MNKILQIALVCCTLIFISLLGVQKSDAQSLGSFKNAAKAKAKKIAERKAKERLERATKSPQENNSNSGSSSSSSRRNADRNQRNAVSSGNVIDNPALQAKVAVLEKMNKFNSETEGNFIDLINELDINNTRSLMAAHTGSSAEQEMSMRLRFYEKNFTDVGKSTSMMEYLMTDIDNDMNPHQKRTDRKKNLRFLLAYTEGNLKIFPQDKNLLEYRAKAEKLEKEFDSKFASREKDINEFLAKRNIKPKGSLYIASAEQMIKKRAATRGKFLKGHIISNSWYYSKNSLGIILYRQAEVQVIVKKSNGDCEIVTYTVRSEKTGSTYAKPYMHQAVGAFPILCDKAAK